MTASNFIKAYLTRSPLGAAIGYVAVVLVFLFMAAVAVLDLLDRRDAVAMAADALSRLEGRGVPRPPVAGVGEATVMTGSPVLEGPTVTVAGAVLMQRGAGAITRARGNILSSPVDFPGDPAKDGFRARAGKSRIQQ